MRPLAQSDGHDAPGLIDELVPCLAAVVDEVVVGFEDAIGEPVVAHELPDVFNRVELGAFRRQGDDGYVGRHDEARRHVPTNLIDNKDGVGSWCDHIRDFRKVQVHRLGVASRQYQGRAVALLWADRTEDVGGSGALVTQRAGARAAFRPPAGDLVLLANMSLVLEPDFYPGCIEALLERDCLQARGEIFLKSSITPSAWA